MRMLLVVLAATGIAWGGLSVAIFSGRSEQTLSQGPVKLALKETPPAPELSKKAMAFDDRWAAELVEPALPKQDRAVPSLMDPKPITTTKFTTQPDDEQKRVKKSESANSKIETKKHDSVLRKSSKRDGVCAKGKRWFTKKNHRYWSCIR